MCVPSHCFQFALSDLCRGLTSRNSNGLFVIGPYSLHIGFLCLSISVQGLTQLEPGLRVTWVSPEPEAINPEGLMGHMGTGVRTQVGLGNSADRG